jgi:hypothetical protein
MTDEILEAWRINNRVNLLLVERISDEGMRCTLSRRGGRNVVRQFAHIHNNRIWHLERRANALAKGGSPLRDARRARSLDALGGATGLSATHRGADPAGK